MLSGEDATPASPCANAFVIDVRAPFAAQMRALIEDAVASGKLVNVSFYADEDDCEVLALDIVPAT